MSVQSIITWRFLEVEAEYARLEALIGKNNAELAELHSAAKGLARMTGAEWADDREDHAE
ncbi:MAG: hypothetical protein AAGA70_03730 [Pseudomonadota bacterium]